MGDFVHGEYTPAALIASRKRDVQQAISAIKALVPSGSDLSTMSAAQIQSLIGDSLSAELVAMALVGMPNGVASLDVNGKIAAAQMPSLAITDTFVVASDAEMQALVAERGDIAVRTDVSKSFVLRGNDPSVLTDWVELITPTSGTGVVQIFGRTGPVVTAQSGDYTAAQITNVPAGSLVSSDVQSAIDELDVRLSQHSHPALEQFHFADSRLLASAGDIIGMHVVPFAMTLSNIGSSMAVSDLSAQPMSFEIIKNGVTSVGLASFPVSGSSAPVNFSGGDLTAGDVLSVKQLASASGVRMVAWNFQADF